MSEFRKKTLDGISWSILAQVVKQALQFVITIILARLLTPDDFGLVGMIVVFTGFATLFNDLGFSAGLVQRQHVEDRHLNSIFWLNIVVGLSLTVVMFIIAPFIAAVYDEPRLTHLTMLVAINFSIIPLTLVQSVILERAMNFRLLAFVETTTVVTAGLVAILLAIGGYGVWSLIWQTLLMSGMRAITLWLVIDWRPRLSFDRAAVAELLRFSANLLGFNTLNYWIRNSDNLLVGKFIGVTDLGIYMRAYSTMLLPITQVTSVLGRVMFPALSSVQEDKVRVKRVYLQAIAMIGLLTFPMMLGLLVVAEHFVLALYGPKWAAVIPLLQIFSLLGMYQSIGVTVGWIYQSQGRTDLMFRWRVNTGLLLIGGFVIGIWIGTVEAVALAYAVINGILLPYPLFKMAGRLIDMTFAEVISQITGILGCAIVMAIMTWSVGLLLPPGWPHWAYLVIQTPTGILIYSLLLHVFNIQAYLEARKMLLERLYNWQVIATKTG